MACSARRFILHIGGRRRNAVAGRGARQRHGFRRAQQRGKPDMVFVSPGNGAFWINGSNQVVAYPDANVGQPNAVVFHKGFFIFTYGNGRTLASNVNVTTINTLNNATAESKPDTLYRPVALGNGQLLLCGSSTLEVWGGANDTGYPFSYIATIPRGIAGAGRDCRRG
jgi:hypothetical protein